MFGATKVTNHKKLTDELDSSCSPVKLNSENTAKEVISSLQNVVENADYQKEKMRITSKKQISIPTEEEPNPLDDLLSYD